MKPNSWRTFARSKRGEGSNWRTSSPNWRQGRGPSERWGVRARAVPVYSERARQRLLAFADIARARGDGEAFIAAVKEVHRRLFTSQHEARPNTFSGAAHRVI